MNVVSIDEFIDLILNGGEFLRFLSDGFCSKVSEERLILTVLRFLYRKGEEVPTRVLPG